VVAIDTLRADGGFSYGDPRDGGFTYDDRRVHVFSDLIASMETTHRDRWLTLCFLPPGVTAVDQLSEPEQRRPCAKFPVWLGEEWAPSRTRSTLLNETMQRMRRKEVHLLNLAGSFCGFSVILELLHARVFPRTVVFAPGRRFPHCAKEIAKTGRDFESFLLSLGYHPDPLNDLLEDAGVPLTILTAVEQSEFLAASGELSLRADIPCQSLSARDELREGAEFDYTCPCAGLQDGLLSSRARIYADEDASVAVDRLWATRPKACRQDKLLLDSNVVERDKGALVDTLNAYFWDRQGRTSELLRLNSKHYCKWSARRPIPSSCWLFSYFEPYAHELGLSPR